ncbi:MAG: aminoglycoside phosphotransferase family protein [Alphaproteobacteria bacterium]
MPESSSLALIKALASALRRHPPFASVAAGDLECMAGGGLAHIHIRIKNRLLIARVPRWSQYGLPPAENLAYQAACFARAAPSARTPRLHATLAPQHGLPFGALIVELIAGRPVRLPADLAAMAECLARLHRLPVPPRHERAPLIDQADPVAGTLAIIEGQAGFLDAAGIAGDARRQIEDELAWARRIANDRARPPHPVTLVGTDTHPGNYLIDAQGHAILHDLEKAMYGSPAIDLAHCTLATSTLWHRACPAVLAPAEILGFYQSYFAAVPRPLALALAPWLLPMRRFTWLRTMTWCVKWTAERGGGDRATGADADAARLIARFFNPEDMHAMRDEWLGGAPLPLAELVCS